MPIAQYSTRLITPPRTLRAIILWQFPVLKKDALAGRVHSTVYDWHSTIDADRAVFNQIDNPATNFAGNYTLAIPGFKEGRLSWTSAFDGLRLAFNNRCRSRSI